MLRGPVPTRPPEPWTRTARRPSWPPACILSCILHFLLMLLLGLSFTPRQKGSTDGLISIVLNATGEAVDYYDDEEGDSPGGPAGAVTGVVEEASQAAESGGAESTSDELFDEPPPVDPSGALPSRSGPLGAGTDELAAADASEMLVGGGVGGTGGSGLSRMPRGGQAKTSVFGVEGEGYKFVYVFDRSASMGSGPHSPLEASKAELKASLAHLAETHQFRIIFYNENTTIFPSGEGLVFATAANKERAMRFIDKITGDGGTKHEEALLEAVRMRPDVIFFLTDADQPELSAAQLHRLAQRNDDRSSINAIEFGLGPQVNTGNFLVKIARQNGGRHVYFDVSRLGRRQ